MSGVPADIFKAYDIRGLYGEQIDGPIAEQIGRAFAHVLSELSGKPVAELRVGLGRDMRLTAPELSERYRAGLANYLSVLDAETQLLTARKALVDIVANQVVARVTLLLAVGGSFDANDASADSSHLTTRSNP